MLVGPSQKLTLPTLPDERQGIQGIIDYLETMDRAIRAYIPSLVSGTIGMMGVRGLSSSGISSQNFVKRVSLSNVATGMWAFANPEPDISYMLWFQGTYPASTIITRVERGTTYVILNCATGMSGLAADVLLLR